MSTQEIMTKTEWIELKADQTPMRAFVARPNGVSGKNPGVIVLQEAFGVNSHIQDVTKRIASHGYVAIAPELYHRHKQGAVFSYTDFDSVKPVMAKMTTDGLASDLRVAYEWLTKEGSVDSSKIGAIGFCMGGRAAFLANATLKLAAAVSFYGGGIADMLENAKNMHGPMMLAWGGKDQHIGTEQPHKVAEALRSAGKSFVSVEFSDADHGFLCNERASYHEKSANEGWALAYEFLMTNFA